MVMITIDNNLIYEMTVKNLGKSEPANVSSGTFEWTENGSQITLSEPAEDIVGFKVGEELLIPKADDGVLMDQILRKNGPFITNRYWRLIELRGNEIPEVKRPSKEPHFILMEQDSLVAGNGGCNSFRGSYTLENSNRIRFSKMASTMMACQDVDYESTYLNVFEMTDNYSLNSQGDTLSLNKARMAPLARFVASTPK
jgi:heat shock protein HslJ